MTDVSITTVHSPIITGYNTRDLFTVTEDEAVIMLKQIDRGIKRLDWAVAILYSRLPKGNKWEGAKKYETFCSEYPDLAERYSEKTFEHFQTALEKLSNPTFVGFDQLSVRQFSDLVRGQSDPTIIQQLIDAKLSGISVQDARQKVLEASKPSEPMPAKAKPPTKLYVTRDKLKIYFETEQDKAIFLSKEKSQKDNDRWHKEHRETLEIQLNRVTEQLNNATGEKIKYRERVEALEAENVKATQEQIDQATAEKDKEIKKLNAVIAKISESVDLMAQERDTIVADQVAAKLAEVEQQKKHLQDVEKGLREEIKSQLEADYQNRLTKLKDAENVFKAKSADEIVNAISRMDRKIQKSLVPDLIAMLQGLLTSL